MELFEVSRPSTFKDYLGCLRVLTEDITVEADCEGVKAVVMDPSYVAMVELELPCGYFDSYSVGEPEKIGLNLDTVIKALGKVTKNDILRVAYDFEIDTRETKNSEGVVIASSQVKKDEKLTLTLISDITRKKIIDCLEYLNEEVPQPRIYFKSKVRIIASTLKRILDDLDGEHVTIETTQDTVTFSHSGDYCIEETPLDKDNDNIIELRIDEPSKTTYTKSYLQDILKAVVKVAEVVTLEFAEDMPIKVDAEIPQGRLIYHVAPCIGV